MQLELQAQQRQAQQEAAEHAKYQQQLMQWQQAQQAAMVSEQTLHLLNAKAYMSSRSVPAAVDAGPQTAAMETTAWTFPSCTLHRCLLFSM